MIPAFENIINDGRSVPRVGGGDPDMGGIYSVTIKCSPRRRG